MAKKKLGQIIGGLLKTVIATAIPGGNILANIKGDNNTPPGTFDRSRTWQDVALELGKLVVYALILYYLGIEVAI